MVTLRGVDFASVKAQVEQASEWLKVQAPAQPPAQQHNARCNDDAHTATAQDGLKRTRRNGRVLVLPQDR